MTTKKTAAKKSRKQVVAAPVEAQAAPAKEPVLASSPETVIQSGIKIRMYRQGLGDCFLLTLPGKDGPFYVVIDCGVVLGTDGPGIQKLHDAVQDISTVTKNKIDLLILTHEHWDHVSGFKQARDLIDNKWTVKEVWTAWTEDPRDPLANKLRAERENTEDALRLAMAHMACNGRERSI